MSKQADPNQDRIKDKGTAHRRLFSAYKIAYPGLTSQKAQFQSNKEWAEIKAKFKGNDEGLYSYVEDRIRYYRNKGSRQAIQFKSHFTTQEVFEVANQKKDDQTRQDDANMESTSREIHKPSGSTPSTQPLTHSNECPEKCPADHSKSISGATHGTSTDKILKRSYATPAQDECKAKIQALESKLNNQLLWRDTEVGSVDPKKIAQTRMDLKKAKQTLQTKENNVKHQQKSRDKQKEKKKVESPLAIRDAGRPRVEEDQPGILECAIDFAIYGSGAEDRRRSDEIQPRKTLNELHQELSDLGYRLSRSALYTRVLPRNSNSNEGKRHVKTVPIRFSKPQNNTTKWHADAHFCTASIRFLEGLASLMGPDLVFFLSQDDKARVHIGVKAAQKQAAMLMHVEYKVSLPDHDFVVGNRHKLIPSVYAGIVIKPGGWGDPKFVTYSGPTHVAIRSGKHDSSTAASHAMDFKRLLELENFQVLSKIEGLVKPVVMISADGGPDENPRYPKVISWGVDLFIEEDLDGFFVVTNAPGHSRFNRAERRMAPLSNQLAGVILRHDNYGSHLDSSGRTIDEELERKNFAHAGKALSELWSRMVLDNYPVSAEYIDPSDKISTPRTVDARWYMTHVRESQYLLQISKCEDRKCCGPPRSNLRAFLPTGFLPPPTLARYEKETSFLKAVPLEEEDLNARFLPLSQTLALTNLEIPNPEGFKQIPYDLYCPSVRSQLSGRVCKTCGTYFATKTALNEHVKTLKHTSIKTLRKSRVTRIEAQRKEEVLCVLQEEGANTETAEWLMAHDLHEHNTDNCIDNRNEEKDESDCLPIIDNIQKWATSPWS